MFRMIVEVVAEAIVIFAFGMTVFIWAAVWNGYL